MKLHENWYRQMMHPLKLCSMASPDPSVNRQINLTISTILRLILSYLFPVVVFALIITVHMFWRAILTWRAISGPEIRRRDESTGGERRRGGGTASAEGESQKGTGNWPSQHRWKSEYIVKWYWLLYNHIQEYQFSFRFWCFLKLISVPICRIDCIVYLNFFLGWK